MSYSSGGNGYAGGSGGRGGRDRDLVDKFKSVNWRGLGRNISNKVKQYAMNLSPLEIQTEEATNLDTWGPHGSVMAEICEACFDPEGYRQVLGVIARRLQEGGERWRMAYKALLLLEYLIKHGPEKVWRDVQQSGSVLQRLTRFEYVDENQRDHGVNVRHRAQEIQELVNNEGRVREERRKAAENKAKYSGYSASEMRTVASTGRGGVSGPGASRMTGFGSDGGYATPASSMNPPKPVPTSPPMHRVSHAHAGGDLAIDGHDGPALDPVSATQARIATMKISSKELHYDDPVEEKPAKKKLSDVRANPKIAASLGLKVVEAPRGAREHPKKAGPADRATTSQRTAVTTDASAGDLLGGLGTAGASDSTEAWDPFGEMNQDTTPGNKGSEAMPAFDPFSTLAGSVPPTTVSKAPSDRPAPTDPFASLQSSDPLNGLHGAVEPTTTVGSKVGEHEGKSDPFADLLL